MGAGKAPIAAALLSFSRIIFVYLVPFIQASSRLELAVPLTSMSVGLHVVHRRPVPKFTLLSQGTSSSRPLHQPLTLRDRPALCACQQPLSTRRQLLGR